MKYILLIFAICMSLAVAAQGPVPAPPQSEPIMIVGATAHLGDGSVIEDAAVGFADGKLTVVAENNSSVDRSGYRLIDGSGKHVYPGFILLNSALGLQEVSSVRAMDDQEEQGEINPNVRAVVSYNTDSEFIPTMRFNGILLAESTPAGGMISGTSSLMEMEGWNWEDAVHTMDVAIHMNWPRRQTRRFDFNTFTVKTEENKKYDEQVRDLQKHFIDAASYRDQADPETNLKLEAMQGLLDGSKRLVIHAERAKEAVEAIRMAQEAGVEHIVLLGGSESLHIASFLVEEEIPLIIPPTHSLPDRPDQAIDLPYELPHLLTEAGVEVSLSHSGMLAGGRNLPFYAGTAVAYGMDKEAALQLITLNPAKALGVDDRLGTLASGKDASLFIADGDALDIRTNVLSHAFIQGKEVILDAKQQHLWQMYAEKYGQ